MSHNAWVALRVLGVVVLLGNLIVTAAPSEVGGSPAPASALTVVEREAPRLPPAEYDTAGTYIQVRQGHGRLTAVNGALRRRVAADQRAYLARARRQRPRGEQGQRGVYRLAIVHRYASASTVVVSALLRAKREAFTGQHEGDGWLAMTVRVPSGRNVSITDLFARPTRGIRALAIAWRKRIRRTPARPRPRDLSRPLPRDPVELRHLRADARRARSRLIRDRCLLSLGRHRSLRRSAATAQPARSRARRWGARPALGGHRRRVTGSVTPARETADERGGEMRWLPVLLVLLIPTAFAVGRETASSNNPAVTKRNQVYTVRQGDVVRVPGTATRCATSAEAGFSNLICTRAPIGRYQFVFYRDSVVVWGPAGPDKEVATYRWEP